MYIYIYIYMLCIYVYPDRYSGRVPTCTFPSWGGALQTLEKVADVKADQVTNTNTNDTNSSNII